MNIRKARAGDAKAIQELVNHFAEKDLMLHRSMESIYDSLREFIVAETKDGTIAGCVAVDIFWGDQAEIRSLAVSEGVSRQGVGAMLIDACKKDAAELGIGRLFAMTYVQDFFEKQGFRKVDIMTLPEKVWRECLEWYAGGHRHETAMIIDLEIGENNR